MKNTIIYSIFTLILLGLFAVNLHKQNEKAAQEEWLNNKIKKMETWGRNSPSTSRKTVINIKEFKGVVSYYNEPKGFGYIIDNETGDELFVHDDGLIDEIVEGDTVSYNIQDSRKGFSCLNVRLCK